jgi:methionine synthase II (cobalamin-independent)
MTIEAEALPGLRVDQVGSLLRPPELIECFKLHARGQTSDEQLRPRKFGVRS